MFKLMAHATETHVDKTESFLHLLEIWYTSIPLYLIATFVIYAVMFFISNKSVNVAFIAMAFWFLATGVMLYDVAPIISTIGIVLGLLSSGIFSFGGLSKK